MGNDFLEETAKPFRKAVNRDAEAMARRGFRCEVANREILVATLLSPISRVRVRDDLVAQVCGTSIKLTGGLYDIAIIESPTTVLLEQLEKGGGFGIACVQKINPISETIDVEIH